MRIIGLTGGIASGKSTVASMLRKLGIPVVDADQIAREVVEPGHPAHRDIIAEFGEAMLDSSGKIDRKRLGAKVFGDATARARLEAITHPRIREETARRLSAIATQGHDLAVYDAALLVETGGRAMVDALVVVNSSKHTQVRRLRERDGLSEQDAKLRLDAQWPLEEKIKVADYLIDNDGSLEDTQAQVEALVRELRDEAKAP